MRKLSYQSIIQPYTWAQAFRAVTILLLVNVAAYAVVKLIEKLFGSIIAAVVCVALVVMVQAAWMIYRRESGVISHWIARVAPQAVLGVVNIYGPFMLLVSNPRIFPDRWANWQATLGRMRISSQGGDTAEQLEQARLHLLLALDMYIARGHAINQAATQTALALCYLRRMRGDPAENVEAAIKYCQAALAVEVYVADPVLHATTLVKYAGALKHRQHPDPTQNIEQAIKLYEQAFTLLNFPTQTVYTPTPALLTILQPFSLPIERAWIAANLAQAYALRLTGTSEDNFEQALAYYDYAEQALSRRARPFDWADITLTIAWIYVERPSGDPRENATRAAQYCQQLVVVWPRNAFPVRWAHVMVCLAYAYEQLAKFDQPESSAHAIDAYRQALTVLTPDLFPHYSRHAAARLGWVLHAGGAFPEARQALELAHQATQNTRSDLHRDAAKRQLSAEGMDIYAYLVDCCLREGDIDTAFTFAALSKGRAFVDALTSTHIDLRQLGHSDPELAQYLAQAEDLRQHIDQVRAQLEYADTIQPDSVRFAELLDLQARFQALWQTISVRFPALTATQQAPTLTAAQARQLAASLNATLVEYYYHPGGWCAFVVTATQIRYVELTKITDQLLEKVIVWRRMITDLQSSTSTRRRLDTGLAHWVLGQWYEAVIAPLRIERGVKQLLLAPFGVLHQLPFSAAYRRAISKPTTDYSTDCYLIDEYNLAQAPSLSALWVSRNQAARNQTAHRQITSAGYASGPLLAVSYPGNDPASLHYLHYAHEEVQTIARYFPDVMELHDEQALRDQIVAHAPEHQIMHLACHGWFDPGRPDQSGLTLADGALTIHEIITQLDLRQAQLVVMSACSSGEVNIEGGGELVGLAQAMMTAGAQTVIASLWPVDDAATAQLFKAFYQQLREGALPAEAMSRAVHIVRNTEGCSHPYYWAAFHVNGLAFRWADA